MPDPAPRPNADEEWESLLRQWRAQPQAQPRPFFYGRLRARLAGEVAMVRPLLPAWLRYPSYAAMIGIMLLLSGDGAALPATIAASQPPPYPSGQSAPSYAR